MAKATTAAPGGAPLAYDRAGRIVFRDFDNRIAAARAELAKAGVATSGANLTALARLQASLGPDEAALATAPTFGSLAYMCVRRDGVQRAVRAADLQQLRLDGRIVQQALTAGHAPSEQLDSQFPVEAAVRLYDGLVRPFEGCLKPGDHILWLPSVALTAAPLSVLLARAPPKLGEGYDLAAADWLVRRHAITYAGSAGAVVAARAQTRRAADFDFLGVGDPVLDATRINADLAALPPLPETRGELEQSARGFARTELLVGTGATEQALRGQLVGSYQLLSFATHGLLRDDLQGLAEPALALTPVSADSANDGLLTANEIADLNLAARFVALSACNTANFDLTRFSTELPALASAFAVAGVPSTLATLWPVESTTSRQVVAAVFAALGADPSRSPAAALAAAQRAFLAAPPGRAYLHPRFWAPFVVLGDGGVAPAVAAAPVRVASVERLSRTGSGGEVLAMERVAGRSIARFIGDADASGANSSGVQASGAKGWRHEARTTGAMRVLFQTGAGVVAGGYGLDADGRAVAVLEAFAPADGAPAQTWRGPMPGLDAFVVAAAPTVAGAVLAVAGRDLSGAGAPARLRLVALNPALVARDLVEIAPPGDAPIDEATLTAIGDRVLLTYSQRYATAPPSPTGDEYDQPACGFQARTRLEMRDQRTGRLLAEKTLAGVVITAAVHRGGRIALAGAVQPGCAAEARAMVASADEALDLQPVYADATAGASEARTLAVLPGERLLVGANKATTLDYGRRPGAPRAAYDPNDLRTLRGGMILTVGPDGTASAPMLLDSGSDLFVSAADASDPADVLVGGSVGGDAAIFHLALLP